jgi:hypothetical protein
MDSMILMVCPHDTAGDPLKWFQFAFYLTKYCEISTKHFKCLDFVEFHDKMADADIVYANPQDSLELMNKLNFIPLVHSVNLYDEIVFIANKEVSNDSLKGLNGEECVSCNGMMVTKVGIKKLLDQNIKPSKIYSKNNWMAVFKAVSQGEKPYGFVYKDFFDGLTELSKESVKKIGETNEKSIFHSIFINPKYQNKAEKITHFLTQANEAEKGVLALKRINIERFIPAVPEEIIQFKKIQVLGSDFME